MSIDPNVLRTEQFVEVGRLLERDATLLVDRWCHRAAKEQVNARRVPQDVLRDDLVSLVGRVGRSLVQTSSDDYEHQIIAVEHGEQRWSAGWSLTELIQDYQILRLVLLDYIEEIFERPIAHREYLAVGLVIDEAIAASVAMYVQFSEENLRAMELELREQALALKDADRKKDIFLATLAHELRNPLSPIQHSVEVLSIKGPADPVVRHSCEVVQRQVNQISRLVDDLLDLTRISQGKVELVKEWVDLNVVIAHAIQTSSPLIKSRKHLLSLQLPPEPLQLMADADRLVQVIANLLNNAAKYTAPGGQIELAARQRDGYVLISVKDSGAGISADMLEKVFDLFSQVDGSESRSHGGLGIGLTLVRSMVELHQGQVRVDSDGIGRGSEFIVQLPIGNEPAHSPEKEKRSAVHTSKRILIVEDSSDTRDTLRELLQICGHQVAVAESGDHALQVLGERLPEVALVDIGLPGMSGYDVARKIRETDSQNIFLVALTGYGQSGDRQKALAAGFNAHLLKPVRLEDLTQLLATIG